MKKRKYDEIDEPNENLSKELVLKAISDKLPFLRNLNKNDNTFKLINFDSEYKEGKSFKIILSLDKGKVIQSKVPSVSQF